jgi:hypothetical protein
MQKDPVYTNGDTSAFKEVSYYTLSMMTAACRSATNMDDEQRTRGTVAMGSGAMGGRTSLETD